MKEFIYWVAIMIILTTVSFQVRSVFRTIKETHELVLKIDQDIIELRWIQERKP